MCDKKKQVFIFLQMYKSSLRVYARHVNHERKSLQDIRTYQPPWSRYCLNSSNGGCAPLRSGMGMFKSSTKNIIFLPTGGPSCPFLRRSKRFSIDCCRPKPLATSKMSRVCLSGTIGLGDFVLHFKENYRWWFPQYGVSVLRRAWVQDWICYLNFTQNQEPERRMFKIRRYESWVKIHLQMCHERITTQVYMNREVLCGGHVL